MLPFIAISVQKNIYFTFLKLIFLSTKWDPKLGLVLMWAGADLDRVESVPELCQHFQIDQSTEFQT